MIAVARRAAKARVTAGSAAHRGHMGAAIRIYIFLNLLYLMSMFYRSTNAVIADELRVDLGATPGELSLITGAFFAAFALMQIPVGMLLDRFGPRRVIALMMLLPVGGAILFASAESVAMATAAQAIIGGGCAVGLMGAVVIFARWFPPDRMATMIALYTGLGNIGIVLTATPLALAVAAIGWRGSFALIAVVTAVLVLLAFLVVRDAPPGHAYHARQPESPRQVFAGVREVLSNRRIYSILALAFVSLSVILILRSLWAGPYLAEVHGLDRIEIGNTLTILSIAMLVGNVGFGPLDRLLDTRKWVSLAGAVATASILAVLAALPDLALWQATALLCALGVTSNYVVTLLAHARAMYPDRLVGRTVTLVNFANFGGIAVLQFASGSIVDLFPASAGYDPVDAYRALFAFLAVAVLLGILAYLPVRDFRPSEDRVA